MRLLTLIPLEALVSVKAAGAGQRLDREIRSGSNLVDEVVDRGGHGLSA
jgi:hypothetical protein